MKTDDEEADAVRWLDIAAERSHTTFIPPSAARTLKKMLGQPLVYPKRLWTVTLHGDNPDLIRSPLPCGNRADAMGCAEGHLARGGVSAVTITRGEALFPEPEEKPKTKTVWSVSHRSKDHTRVGGGGSDDFETAMERARELAKAGMIVTITPREEPV